jgi:FkbM family methyltransferase
MMLRRFVERMVRGSSFRRNIKVMNQLVPIHVSPDAQLKYLKPGACSFDRDLVELAEKHLTADSVVWDVGANVGTFSVAAATVAHRGKVVAIEADIWLAQLVRRTAAEAAHGGRIEVLPSAISDKCGTARFEVAERGRASNALEAVGGDSPTSGGKRQIQLVPTLTLDALLETLPSPNFVKIDVEGAEALVFAGASRLLKEVRPLIYAEISSKTALQVADVMRGASYGVLGKPGYDVAAVSYENILFAPLENL